MPPTTAPPTPSDAERAALRARPRYRDLELLVDREALARLTAANATRAEGDPEDDRIPVAMSSEIAVPRYDWWEDERYLEVLDHSPGAIDLSYARDGVPFLLEHQRADQHGLIEDVTLGADRKLRGMLRMSKAQRSQEIRQDILDGIRKKVSAGYRLSDDYEQTPDPNGGPPTRRYRNWTPMECSSVSIPADYDVGYGRADDASLEAALRALPPDQQAALRAALRSSPSPKERTMKDDEKGGGTTVADEQQRRSIQVSATEAERKRAADISALCDEHAIPSKERTALVEAGASVEDAQRKVLAIVRERMKNPTPAGPAIELSASERKRFSFARAIAAEAGDLLGQRVDAGFEREISTELEKKLPESYKRRGGILIPTVTQRSSIDEAIVAQERALAIRAGLDSGTATKGQELKFTQAGDFISLLRARMKVRALGARVLGGLTGPVSFPRQTAGASGSWVGENSGADVADSNLLLDLVTLAVKTYQASSSYSRQLLVAALSGSVDAENMTRDDLVIAHALAFDLAALTGSGSSNQPRGLYNTTGVGSVAIGTNGGAPTYGSVIDLETAVASANADVDSMGYLTHPVMRGKLKQTQKFATTNGDPVWERDGTMNGYRAEVSTQSPGALTKGTSTDCYGVAFGDWSQMILGEWGVIELIVDPLRLKKQGMIEVTSFQMGDVGVRLPAAFAVDKDWRNV